MKQVYTTRPKYLPAYTLRDLVCRNLVTLWNERLFSFCRLYQLYNYTKQLKYSTRGAELWYGVASTAFSNCERLGQNQQYLEQTALQTNIKEEGNAIWNRNNWSKLNYKMVPQNPDLNLIGVWWGHLTSR